MFRSFIVLPKARRRLCSIKRFLHLILNMLIGGCNKRCFLENAPLHATVPDIEQLINDISSKFTLLCWLIKSKPRRSTFHLKEVTTTWTLCVWDTRHSLWSNLFCFAEAFKMSSEMPLSIDWQHRCPVRRCCVVVRRGGFQLMRITITYHHIADIYSETMNNIQNER